MKCKAWLLVGLMPACAGGATPASFSRNAHGVAISFSNGARLTVKTEGDRVVGITRVAVNGQSLRSPQFAAHPVFKLADGASHAGCRLESVERAGEAVVLRCRLKPKAGAGEDQLDWRFEPRSEAVGDRAYAGFAYRYEFRSATRKLDEILDLGTWEIGGDIDGKFVQPGALATRAGAFRTYRSWAFQSTPWFRFQCGADGMLYDVYETVSPVITWLEKRADSPLLHTFDVTLQELKTQGGTPFRRIMFCPQGGCRGLECVDEYTRVYDHLERRARGEFGIAEPEYVPAVKAAQCRDETFELRIKDLAGMADLGFKAMWMCTLESVSSKIQKRKSVNAGIYSLDPAEILGGASGLRKLVEAARRHGIKVYTWAPGGQLRAESEILKAHPEWLLHVAKGKRRPLGGSADLHSGYYDYAIKKYADLHQQIGIEGIWFDSYSSAATPVQVRPDGTRYFQIRKAFQMLADTQKAGIRNVQLEGAGPAGQDAGTCGYLPVGEPLSYKKALYVYSCRPEKVNYYYRSIANKAFPMLPYRYVLWTYEYKSLAQFPELRRQVRRANLDWAAVQDLMVHRRLIAAADPWKDMGVEWSKPGSPARALFAYGEFKYRVPSGARVTDVTEGKVVRRGGVLRTKCCHTYRIE